MSKNPDSELHRFIENRNLELQASSHVPLYYQLYRLLYLFIKRQGLVKGDRFPSEEAIAECFNVSRPTVRRAINELQRWGWLDRQRGRGSHLKRSPDLRLGFLRANLTFMDGSAEPISHRSDIVSRGIYPATSDIAAVLGIEEKAPMIFMRRLFYAGRELLMVCDSHLSAPRFAGLESIPLVNGSLYITLREIYNCNILRSDWSVQADEAIEPAVAELLSIPLFSPILMLRGVRYDVDGAPVEIYFCHINQGMSVQDSVTHPQSGDPDRIAPS